MRPNRRRVLEFLAVAAVLFLGSGFAQTQAPPPARAPVEAGRSAPAVLGKLHIEPASFGRLPRPMDLVARYGGEEFVMVLPEIDGEGVRAILGNVLAAVDALGIGHADSSAAPHVTVSLGAVTVRPGPQDDLHGAIEAADALLYASKEGGRHRATYSDEGGVKHTVAP